MNTVEVDSSNRSRMAFSLRVAALREKIAHFRLSKKEKLSSIELVNLQSLIRNKAANIIEFTLLMNNIKIHRQRILELVKSNIGDFPVIQLVHSGKMSIQDGEQEFAQFLEGRRVQNPLIRLWIAKMVDEYKGGISKK